MSEALLEICVDSVASALAAKNGGADRLELCGQLPIGGVTPSPALFHLVRKRFPGKINVLIRPRGGDFLYSEEEIVQMCDEIIRFRDMGADGIVIGALTAEGELDIKVLKRLLSHKKGMSATLHRAFDFTKDPFQALEEAIALGFDAILSSGQETTALKGCTLLQRLSLSADKRIQMIAGGGVNCENLIEIFRKTNISVFHASAKKDFKSGMRFKRTLSLGSYDQMGDFLFKTDELEVAALKRLVQTIGESNALS